MPFGTPLSKSLASFTSNRHDFSMPTAGLEISLFFSVRLLKIDFPKNGYKKTRDGYPCAQLKERKVLEYKKPPVEETAIGTIISYNTFASAAQKRTDLGLNTNAIRND
ncbi:uncharacterized protein LOC129975639 [Argiope bruennichi]|uniref:uncharacterized protein LOC129975639 n=1 Tax=Argiope bruennichi TaxID=94029 RepID=UPI002494FB22|nr:uncharacterized protein LOC129975639 [Argiope bruennichi]